MKDIDEILERSMDETSPGCAFAMIKEGRVSHQHCIGLSSMERKHHIDSDTVFHVASLSKQFTALCIKILERDNRLKLDDKFNEYLAEKCLSGNDISIEDLLFHKSGLRDQWELIQLKGKKLTEEITQEEIIQLIRKQRDLNFPPGSDYQYCSSGYTLLARIVEEITNKSFPQFCRDNIFEPLGMDDTFFRDQKTKLKLDDEALSYIKSENGYLPVPMNFLTYGATNLKTTLEDMIKWETALQDDKSLFHDLVSIIEKVRLNNGEIVNYGIGCVISKLKGKSVCRHNGYDAGFRSHFLRIPELSLSLILLSNNGEINAGSILTQIAELFIDDVEDNSTFPAAIEIDNDDLKKRESLYFDPKTSLSRKLIMENNRLFLKLGRGLELESLSHNEMRIKDRNFARYRFEEENSKMIERIGNNPAAIYHRVEEYVPSDREMNLYCGRYHSKELEIEVEIKKEKSNLCLMANGAKHEYTPCYKDCFLRIPNEAIDDIQNMAVMFVYEKSEIAGFNLSTRDVQCLWFDKTEERHP